MPLSEIIPREQLSAWERWELGSLGPTHSKADAEKAAADAHEQALAQARAQGYAEGRAQAAAEQARLSALATSLTHCVAEHEQRLVDEVLDLALLLARQMVGEALAVRREFLLPVVSGALRQLPQTTQRIDIVLHPSDIALVRDYIAAEPLGDRCHFIAHSTIAPGGCRIETEQCEMDATVGSRWKHLLASLGRTGEWLEPA